MNVVSLFDGMSMGQIALERIGIIPDLYLASEIEKQPMAVTQFHYPKTVQMGDVTKIHFKDNVLDTENGQFNVGNVDLLMGGSPCTSLSNAGKGEGFNGSSGLFYEYLRLRDEIKPKYFLLENVKMKSEWRDEITKCMGVEPILINSALVSAQNRPRYYWTNIPNVTIPADKGLVLKDILEQNVRGKFVLSAKRLNLVTNGKYQSAKKICDINGKSSCLMAGMGMGGGTEPKVWDNEVLRRITPLECERLQTVEDNWTYVPYLKKWMSDSHRYKMLGNGWTVDVIAHILKGIK